MFRIPRGLFSFILLLGSVPILVLIALEIYLNLNSTQLPNSSWINQFADEFMMTAMLSVILVLLWMIAIIFRACRTDLLASLLSFPAILSIALLFVTFSAALHDIYHVRILPTSVFEYLDDLISMDNIETFIIGCLSAFFLAMIIGTISLTALIGKRPLARIIVPLQVVFLPIGIWWLQPKLRAKAERKPIEHVEEHLLE